MSKKPKTGLEGLLRPEDSILVLIDHQPYQFHDMAVRRMVQAGAVPINWMAVLGEWQRD